MKIMNKIAQVIATSALLAVLVIVPASVHAQGSGVIEVGGGATTPPAPSPTTTLPSTGGSEPAPTTPATPNTGIAPQDNKLVQNTLVFIGGGALGTAVAFGVITARKKNLF